MCGRATLAAHRQQWGVAHTIFSEALSLHPEYDLALAGIGVCHYNAGNKQAAWDSFERAVQRNPENMRGLLGMIELGYQLQKLPRVQSALESYLEMHPADIEFLYSLAGCYFAQDMLDEAKREVEKITLFEPSHRHAIELQGMITHKLGLEQRDIPLTK